MKGLNEMFFEKNKDVFQMNEGLEKFKVLYTQIGLKKVGLRIYT